MSILKQKAAIMRSPAKRGALSVHQSTFEWLVPKMWLTDNPNLMDKIKTQLARTILRSLPLNSARNFFSVSSTFLISGGIRFKILGPSYLKLFRPLLKILKVKKYCTIRFQIMNNEYGHLGRWYFKATLYERFLN